MTKPLRPVVFFAFADSHGVERRYLRYLAEEANQVTRAMERANRTDEFKVIVRQNASPRDVWEVLEDPDLGDRIAVFHFGGHADGKTVLLASREGEAAEIHAAGLASFLGTLRSLRLVFLNGCSTETQVGALLDAGVPAVVSTSQAINDKVATDFAAAFYWHLAAGASLAVAFTKAEGKVKAGLGEKSPFRRSFLPKVGDSNPKWSWRLSPADDSKVKKWTLSSEIKSGRLSEAPQIRDDLVYLCDRQPQESMLETRLKSHRTKSPRRPLAVLMHGDYRQELDTFVARLRDPTLPRFLGRAPVQRFGPLSFKDPHEGNLTDRLSPLGWALAGALCGSRDAGLKEMVAAVAARQSPVMIDVVFSLEEDGRNLKKLLITWLNQLANWNDLPEGQELLFVLRFPYTAPRGASWLRFFRKRSDKAAAKLFKKIVKKAPSGLNVVELPPLRNVLEGDVRLWIEEHACKALDGMTSSSLICDRLKQRVQELFRDSPSLPMEELAPKLRSELLKCIHQGGG